MSEVLVSSGVYNNLRRAGQYIEYDPEAMGIMADAFGVSCPSKGRRICVMYKGDIETQEVYAQYGGPKVEQIKSKVYTQGPEREESVIKPNSRKVFLAVIGNERSQRRLDPEGLAESTADRLWQSRVKRIEHVAGSIGAAAGLAAFAADCVFRPAGWVEAAEAVSGIPFALAAFYALGKCERMRPSIEGLASPLVLSPWPEARDLNR